MSEEEKSDVNLTSDECHLTCTDGPEPALDASLLNGSTVVRWGSEPLPRYVLDWIYVYMGILHVCIHTGHDRESETFDACFDVLFRAEWLKELVRCEHASFCKTWGASPDFSPPTYVHAALLRTFHHANVMPDSSLHVVHTIMFREDAIMHDAKNWKKYFKDLLRQMQSLLEYIQQSNVLIVDHMRAPVSLCIHPSDGGATRGVVVQCNDACTCNELKKKTE